MRQDHSAEIIALLTRIAAALERAYPAVAAPLPVGPRVFPAWPPPQPNGPAHDFNTYRPQNT